MNTFEILDDEGNVINTIVASEDFVEANYPGHYRAVEVAETPEPAPTPRRVLSHFGFRKLFTLNEQVILDSFDIAEFSAVHPVLSQLDPMQKAVLRTAVKSYETAQEVDLDEPAVQQFIGLLAQMGLLDNPERAAVILAGEAPSV
jgi:hypothetical protein